MWLVSSGDPQTVHDPHDGLLRFAILSEVGRRLQNICQRKILVLRGIPTFHSPLDMSSETLLRHISLDVVLVIDDNTFAD